MPRAATAAATLPEPKMCAVYTRKSTSAGLEQEFNTLDAQREACERYIQGQGHNGWLLLPDRYDDGGFTGANTSRPGFQRLLADVEAGKVDVIVVYKIDRLSRSLLDFMKIMERLNAAGASFTSITQNFSTADAMGRLTLNMLMSFAEFEREMIAERTRDKIAAARRKGKWTGGRVPLGFDIEDRHLVVNELEAVVVREVFDLYLQLRSALEVMRELNRRGRCTKRHRTKAGVLNDARPWDKPAVLRVLKNPLFAGYISLGDELHEGEHEAVVDREIYHRVQALLDEHKKSGNRRGRNPDYLLTGLLRCGSCGSALTTASTTTRGKLYRYYRCCRQGKEGGESCPSKQLPASAIEDFVVERIRKAASDPSLVEDVTAKLQQKVQGRRHELQTERKALPTAIASLSVEANTLVDSLAGTTGTARRLLEERVEALGQELGRHESRLAEVQRALAALKQTEIEGRWVAETLSRFDDVWDALTPENRVRLVRALVRKVTVDEAENEVSVEMVEL